VKVENCRPIVLFRTRADSHIVTIILHISRL